MNLYETPAYLAEYLFFHYGRPRDFCPYPFAPPEALEFQKRAVETMVGRVPRRGGKTRGLDLGCAVGRSSFELARRVDEVIGIDFSRRFIAAARKLAAKGEVLHSIREEGKLTRPVRMVLKRGLRKGRVRFRVGDAQNLPASLGEFDVVLALNLIDRLPDPMKFLRRAPRLVKPGGRLVIASPYTWTEDYTPPKNWLGGRKRAGRAVRTFETLKKILSPHFRLVKRRDLPFLIREHARKFQLVVADATAWEKRSENVLKKWRGKGRLPGGQPVDDYLKRARDADRG